MPVDFQDAAYRHWQDAELLHTDNSLANADHLYGFAAECALKAIMGITLDASGRPQDKHHRVHIDKFWHIFVTFANQRSGSNLLAMLGNTNDPFQNWRAEQRYLHRNDIQNSDVQQHKQATHNIMKMLSSQILNGTWP